MKRAMREFWENTPCGTRDVPYREGSEDFFRKIEDERDEREPFISDFARFSEWKGRRVLEVGFGAATDLIRFARAGAKVCGIDLTPHALVLARRRLAMEGLSADIRCADAESIPFEDGAFDFVYSWGVIHHTENTQKAADEIMRVARPGARVCVMIYHRHSLVALQCWLLHALMRGKPWRTLSDVIGRHIESPGTKAYSIGEARRMFSGLAELNVTPVITPYDLRVGRRTYLPSGCRKLLPSRLGWFLVVTGRKRQ